jgi:hypothetical protein
LASAAAVDAAYYSASSVFRAVVSCIFEHHMIVVLLYIIRPDEDRRDAPFPQSESA